MPKLSKKSNKKVVKKVVKKSNKKIFGGSDNGGININSLKEDSETCKKCYQLKQDGNKPNHQPEIRYSIDPSTTKPYGHSNNNNSNNSNKKILPTSTPKFVKTLNKTPDFVSEAPYQGY